MQITPYNGKKTNDDESHYGFFIVLALIIIAFLSGLYFYWRFSMKKMREKATTQTTLTTKFKGSELLSFTEKDILVDKKWTLSSGFHPTVTFNLTTSPSVNNTDRVSLFYRYSGTKEWNVIDAKEQESHKYKTVLRDLEKDMPYDYLFAVRTSDTILYSNIVHFILK